MLDLALRRTTPISRRQASREATRPGCVLNSRAGVVPPLTALLLPPQKGQVVWVGSVSGGGCVGPGAVPAGSRCRDAARAPHEAWPH